MQPTPSQNIRDDFLLDPLVIFLNHGSFGATPRPVFESYQRWQRELERQPVEFLGRRAPELTRASRTALAEYLCTSADNLVYVTNATTGVNIAARSFGLKENDEVLASDHEYGALDRTWRFLSQKHGFKYINHPVRVPVTTVDDFVSFFWQAVTPNTRVIFLSHITSPTAITFPVKEICQKAREAGILTIIDGAHAPGQLALNLTELGADIYTGNLHKWLCAPKGAAFLYARPEVQPLIEPLIVSWGWHSDRPGPSRFIDEQEWTGTRDISAFLAVPDAIRYQAEHDWPQVRVACRRLAGSTQARIAALTSLPPFHPDRPEWYTQMAAAELPAQTDLDWLKNTLYDRYRIEVPLIEWNGRKLVRFSFQIYNTPREADALVDALGELLDLV